MGQFPKLEFPPPHDTRNIYPVTQRKSEPMNEAGNDLTNGQKTSSLHAQRAQGVIPRPLHLLLLDPLFNQVRRRVYSVLIAGYRHYTFPSSRCENPLLRYLDVGPADLLDFDQRSSARTLTHCFLLINTKPERVDKT